MSLNEKQRRFAVEYVKDLNATQAAIRAGYAAGSAKVTGSRLLSHANVRKLLEILLAERIERTQVDADWTLRRLVAEAEADLADLYDENMRLKPVHEWPEVWRQGLVQGVDVQQIGDGEGTVTRVRLSDRVKRLELIGKHVDVSAFQERHVVTGEDGGPVQFVIQPVRAKGEIEESGREEMKK